MVEHLRDRLWTFDRYFMHQRLYPVLLFGVLLIFGCRSESPDTDAAEPPIAQPDRGDTALTPPPANAEESDEALVLVLGNSIAAGYGLGEEQAFPALLQEKIDSLGWSARVVNAGVSGETTAGGRNRIDWLLNQYHVDILLIELGGNDGLRGIDPEATKRNLQQIIDKTQARYPEARIVLAGMQIPPNLGQDYTERFRRIYSEIAEEKEVELIPFLLEGVGGVPRLNQGDGIHPTAEGQRVVTENVWDVLRPVLQEELPETEA